MNSPQMSPGGILSQMLLGNRAQQAIYVAAKLGIADLLKDGPKGSEELAQATGAHAGSLYRLLRVLASFGIFAEDEQCRPKVRHHAIAQRVRAEFGVLIKQRKFSPELAGGHF